MRNTSNYIILIILIFFQVITANAQTQQKPTNEIQLALQKLNTLGSVLYFAAHPDDENTKLISWLSQEQKYRTAYLSLTRGDGGQNLLGTDLGINLGLIRTQELLAARAIDKGEQLFSSAYDFGFSKTHEETFQFWDHETALREAVWIIRKFQPDVIITRFPPDKRGGHGHHQASAILAHEAFLAAADKNKFPEQLKTLSTWKAKRLIWNTANFGGQNNTSEEQLKIDIGHYNPLLGQSYGEIAAKSRSQHKTQGFGSASSKGIAIEYFDHVAGNKATIGLMDDVETSWKRFPNTDHIQKLITKLYTEFQSLHPEKSVDDLIKLKKALEGYKNNTKSIDKSNLEYWIRQKQKEVNELIIDCAGIWTEAYTSQNNYALGKEFPIQLEAIIRNPINKLEIIAINNQQINQNLLTNNLWKGNTKISSNETSQPYWLIQPNTLGKFNIPIESVGYPTNPNSAKVNFTIKINNEIMTIEQEIKYRYVDPVRGEMHDPLVILPELTAEVSSNIILSKNQEEQSVDITFTRNDNTKSQFEISIPSVKGWNISNDKIILDFGTQNTLTKTLILKPTTNNSSRAVLTLVYKDKPLQHIKTLSYPHIPSITWFPTTEVICQNIELNNPIKNLGYIAGAGDMIAESLPKIGINVSNLSEKDLISNNLKQFDAIVLGVRFYNVIKNSESSLKQLLQYVENGGVVLTQYNVNTKLLSEKLGPYNFTLGRERVTEENSEFLFDANDISFKYPNKINKADFDGWVQERGLYFAENIDAKYRTPLQMHDKDENFHKGSLLITKYGKGKFVYTSLSFFRQLPAGVPGAYRLFVNLLANEK